MMMTAMMTMVARDDNDSNDDNYSNDDKEGDAVSIKMMITEGRGAGRKQRINITMT